MKLLLWFDIFLITIKSYMPTTFFIWYVFVSCSDGEILSLSSESDQGNTGPTLYRLEIMRIELFSVYGVQACVLHFTWSYL